MKSLYIIIISLLPIFSFSQKLFTVNEININEGLKSKHGKYLKLSDYIIRNSDATPNDLYLKTVLWFNQNFKGVRFLKNYGQHNAVLCGLRYATGDYCITLDDDLQNPPEEIPKFLKF